MLRGGIITLKTQPCIHLSIHLSIHLFIIHSSIHPYSHPFIHLFIYSSFHLSINLSYIHLSSIYPYSIDRSIIYPSIAPSIVHSLFIYPPIHLRPLTNPSTIHSFIHPSTHLSTTHSFIYPFIHQSSLMNLFIHLSIIDPSMIHHPSIHTPLIHPSIHPSICPLVCPLHLHTRWSSCWPLKHDGVNLRRTEGLHLSGVGWWCSHSGKLAVPPGSRCCGGHGVKPSFLSSLSAFAQALITLFHFSGQEAPLLLLPRASLTFPAESRASAATGALTRNTAGGNDNCRRLFSSVDIFFYG